MEPEEKDEMHASQLHGNPTTATETNGATCSYPLETIMALQKMLEGGIPEHTAAEASCSPVQATPVHEPRSANLTDMYTRVTSAAREWVEKIHNVFTRGRKTKKATGKGSSAQHTG